MNNIGPAIDRFRATCIGAFSDRPDQYFGVCFERRRLARTSFPNKGQGQTMPCSSPWPYCTLPFTWHILDEIPESFQTFCYFKYLWKKCSILSNGITDRLS